MKTRRFLALLLCVILSLGLLPLAAGAETIDTGRELPVISSWDYPGLRIVPCRYTGSAYTDDLVIAAHNYASHFGRLRELSQGDSIRFTDTDGNVFDYVVSELEILEPYAVSQMTEGDWDLTLFTCTPGGQYRVTLRCNRK